MKKTLLPFLLIVFLLSLSVKFGQIDIAKAATQDNTTGTYTDTFSNSLGIGTTTQTYVTSGSVKLDLGTTSFYAPFDTDLNATSSLGSGTANNAGLTFPSLTSSGYVNSALNAQTDKTLRFETTDNLATNKAQIDMWLKTNPDFYNNGDQSGKFNQPYQIYYDAISDFIYVADYSNSRIVKTKIDGEGWQTLGHYGTGYGNFYLPAGIYYDSVSDFLYIADTGNHRIVKAKIDGTGWVNIANPVETIFETQSDDMKLEFSAHENLLRFYPRKSDQGHVMTSAFLDWEPDEWHALSLSYDQTLGTADLYIDNVLNVSHTFSTSWTPPSFGQYFYVGSDKDGTYSSAWKGPLDELTITQDTDLYDSSGSFVTNEITPSTNGTLSWNEISISQTLNSGTVTYDVLDGDTADGGVAIAGFSTLSANGSGKISLKPFLFNL